MTDAEEKDSIANNCAILRTRNIHAQIESIEVRYEESGYSLACQV